MNDLQVEVAKEAIKLAGDFLKVLLGPAAEEAGLMLQDNLRAWRFKNAMKLALEAQALLKQKGISPRQVSPKILLPILEKGSLETDELLKEKWANLLTNAANSQAPELHVSYPTILNQLSKQEVLILDFIYRHNTPGRHELTIEHKFLRQDLELREDEYDVAVDHLTSLGLCEGSGVAVKSTYSGLGELTTSKSILMKKFGYEFVKACTIE